MLNYVVQALLYTKPLAAWLLYLAVKIMDEQSYRYMHEVLSH